MLNTDLRHSEMDAATSNCALAITASIQKKVPRITNMKIKVEVSKHEVHRLKSNDVSAMFEQQHQLKDDTKDQQLYLFIDEQWKTKTKYDKQRSKPLSKNIDKVLKNLNFDKAYRLSRNAETTVLNSDQ
ncbi:hypothetical protein CU098_004568, partial [Rhizopus stolonifer]